MVNESVFPADLLCQDLALRELYTRALNKALKDPEIRDGFDYVGVRPLPIRIEMMREAEEIFAAVPYEYNAYLLARDGGRRRLDEWVDLIGLDIARGHLKGRLAAIGYTVTVLGVSVLLFSLLVGWTIPWLVEVPTLFIGGLALLGSWVSTRPVAPVLLDRVYRLVRPLAFVPGTAWMARGALVRALEENELTAQLRQRVNARRQDRFDHDFSVTGHPELSEAFDSVYHVPTVVTRELDDLLNRLSSASIGLAGPRGSGKSTLIRRYCQEPPEMTDQADLRCLVSAPVEYAPRDFVLHLFATFCHRSLRYFATVGRPRFAFRLTRIVLAYWLVAWAVVEWPEEAVSTLATLADLLTPILERFYETAASLIPAEVANALFTSSEKTAQLISLVTVGAGTAHLLIAAYRHRSARRAGRPARLVVRARGHLAQIRYLQTFTSGWSGGVKAPAWVEGQVSYNRSRAEQPLSYPEIVSAFRAYARDVAVFLRPAHSVYIGVDELDKIGSGEDAQRFLNEIKGIFGLPNTYFMISVSDDAMNAFERRGLPFRDAFDSSFDEIIRVGLLVYDESLRLLNRRVVGLAEPYIAFCHCLSGGLSRDLIRAARSVISIGRGLSDGAKLEPICAAVIREELCNKARAIVESARDHTMPLDVLDLMHGLARRDRVPATRQVLKSLLDHPLDGPSLEFATYIYFCATLEEIFTSHLTVDRVRGSRIFDDLAGARHAFTIDAQLAWRSISKIRRSWNLTVWEAPD
ncbi:hypothetical protein [Sphaerisporangium corydalis]|uniref:KAP NTPase domain-containing protein n=1 Tax=Sphaerisporangium corydalis TaxID=1441875 RepID=A0ABV9E7C7_9ACTN|nr:hypothetical protein [Sphaerisporangium corydalis]